MKIVILEPVEPDSTTAKKISHIHSLLNKNGDELIHQIADNNLFASVMRHQPDVVFNLASIYGWEKTNLIPALLEIAGVRYTGSSMMGLSLARHASKLFPLLLASGVPMAPFVITKAGDPALPDDFYYPLALFCDGFRRGQAIKNQSELKKALKNLPVREDVAIQELVSGEISSIYILDSVPFLSHKDPNLIEYAIKAYQLFEARGLARFDFVKSDGHYLDNIDLSPDPLDESLVSSAVEDGWDEMKLLQTLLKHAGRDIRAPRKKIAASQTA
jgi:D-alanine-D-alanine ligase-like ATP-grasp enzyme